MTGRWLQPLTLDEFAAIQLHDILNDEMESLRVELHEHRDNGDGLAWARVKLSIGDLHAVWLSLDRQLRDLGNPPSDTFEAYMLEVKRWSERMPRSKANAAAHSAATRKRQELRARVLAARVAYRAKGKG